MSRFNFDITRREVVDFIRSPAVYRYNLAQNLALLSDDPSVIRRFFQVEIQQYFNDTWLTMEAENMFMRYYQRGQAFSYFCIIPMIVNAKVNLVASSGFQCESDDKEIDEILNEIKDKANFERLFCEGVYWESGIGDFAYRLSYCPELSHKPIVDIIDPQYLDVNYSRGHVKSYVIKTASAEHPNVELHEIYSKNKNGYAQLDYRFRVDGEYVDPANESLMKECQRDFPDVDLSHVDFPFKFFPIVFKKNDNINQLYKGERGVPDIQGLASIEDALTETISDLIDAIRKGGVKVFMDDSLIPQTEDGKDLSVNFFNKTIITTRGSSSPVANNELYKVVQGDIKWQAYVETIKTLMTTAINKAGLSPTTLGLTGLESINSSQESQDAREKPSMRKREIALNGWRKTLTELFNRYLQITDYIENRDIEDYGDLINITFNEYTNPTVENVTDILVKQVNAGLKSPLTAIKDLNKGMSDEEAQDEYYRVLASQQANVVNEDEVVEEDVSDDETDNYDETDDYDDEEAGELEETETATENG